MNSEDLTVKIEISGLDKEQYDHLISDLIDDGAVLSEDGVFRLKADDVSDFYVDQTG